MSDLGNFFAKRDLKKMKKKKKLREHSSGDASASEHYEKTCLPATADVDGTQVTEAKNVAIKEPDDGWVDFEDPVSAQVHTGGRKVASLSAQNAKEKVDDREITKENFNGWKVKTDKHEDPKIEQVEKEGTRLSIKKSWRAAGLDYSSTALFPSLDDSVDAPKLPVRRKAAGSYARSSNMSGRPRFINSRATSSPTVNNSTLAASDGPRVPCMKFNHKACNGKELQKPIGVKMSDSYASRADLVRRPDFKDSRTNSERFSTSAGASSSKSTVPCTISLKPRSFESDEREMKRSLSSREAKCNGRTTAETSLLQNPGTVIDKLAREASSEPTGKPFVRSVLPSTKTSGRPVDSADVYSRSGQADTPYRSMEAQISDRSEGCEIDEVPNSSAPLSVQSRLKSFGKQDPKGSFEVKNHDSISSGASVCDLARSV